MPHFYAIGWLHRKDYEHAGFSLLPVTDNSGRRIRILAPTFVAILIPTTSLPFFADISGVVYLTGSVLLGLLFLFFGIYFSRSLSNISAGRFFNVSALYLPALFLLLIFDKTA